MTLTSNARRNMQLHAALGAVLKLFRDEIIKTAETMGSGWVDYMFPKPGQTEPSQKWTYVKRVTIDRVPGLVGSGLYPE